MSREAQGKVSVLFAKNAEAVEKTGDGLSRCIPHYTSCKDYKKVRRGEENARNRTRDSEYEFTTTKGSSREALGSVVVIGLTVHDDRSVSAIFEKLHDVFSFSCHAVPARFCTGALFEAAEASPAKIKIDWH